jgi:2-polyprenyl-3-methyl-5-hydroxy-6-metoxy-1,4-benzoquinol methylase
MTPCEEGTRSHYDALLARNYVWMAGGWEGNCERNRRFFSANAVVPRRSGVAADLGAGCGFQSVPLADAGFRVIAVDFCRQILDTLEKQAGTRSISTIHADILSFESWSGHNPELITCMGDTLTHLPDLDEVRSLVRQCAEELPAGGRFIVSCRDYSREPAGSSVVIPVQRDVAGIFLCRLEYEMDRVRVTDILYTKESGKWVRTCGSYSKIRIAPDLLTGMLTGEGFSIVFQETLDGITSIIGQKER